MKKTVSILLGSGFSIPEGLPTVNDINKRMSKIDESEIMIHSSMRAIFLNGQKDENRWSRSEERLFVQEFIEFYNSKILKPDEPFHYETFYDFYALYLHEGKVNKEVLDTFCDEFASKHIKGESTFDTYNRISYFNRTFNQLLSSLLHRTKYLGEITSFSGNSYQGFIGYLTELLKSFDVKVHSLNHDLFFEWLMNYSSGLSEYLCDGFEYDGSPFYGILRSRKNIEGFDLQKSYRVKLSQFTERFDNNLCLFKLHGSINNYIVHTDGSDTSRIHWEYDIEELYKEKSDPVSGKSSTVGAIENVDPDFLTGTYNKLIYYKNDPYYQTLFKHFEDNLAVSDFLLVIGYGFADPGINEYLETHFLSKGKKMVVIDPNLPTSDLLKKYTFIHIACGVTDVTREKYLELLSY